MTAATPAQPPKLRPRAEWSVFIRDHHRGFIDWATYEANQQRLAQNTRPRPHHSGGAVREGAALLQGIAMCGHCGRRLHTHYRGRYPAPGYHCADKNLVNGRGEYCLNVGGVQIDAAVAKAFLAALAPAGLAASLQAVEQLQADHEATLAQFRRDLERARYDAQRAERRYRAVDPDNRLVARGLEAEWESALRALEGRRSRARESRTFATASPDRRGTRFDPRARQGSQRLGPRRRRRSRSQGTAAHAARGGRLSVCASNTMRI